MIVTVYFFGLHKPMTYSFRDREFQVTTQDYINLWKGARNLWPAAFDG